MSVRTDQGGPAHGPQGPPGPPPRPGKGGKKNPGNTGGNHGARSRRIGLAVSNLVNALVEKGFNGADAQRFAIMALKQDGVKIGQGGHVRYKGGRYNAAAFAKTGLVDYVTGAKAKALNEAAVKADPNYQAALAQLALTQQQGQAGLDAQRRNALLDFGDANLVQGDPALAAAVGANPFSTSRLLQQGYEQNQAAAAQAANRAGTAYGGGAISGQLAAQHAFAGSEANASEAVGNLLGSLSLQGASLAQNQALGGQQALLQTQQNLANEGVLSASAPKVDTTGQYHLYRAQQAAKRRQRQGGSPAAPPSPF